MTFILSGQNTLANQFLLELRDKNIQKDRARFRNNMERLGNIMAYEISRKLSYTEKIVETPLGKSRTQVIGNMPVLVTILRAGLPYYQGFQNYFDQADVGFIGAYRKEGTGAVNIQLDYVASSSLTGKTLILIDPMLATGKSMIDSVLTLSKSGAPDYIHIASLIASPEGIKYLEEKMSIPYTLWTFSVDEKLDERFYIFPGLGDAGDLSFGTKI